MPEIAERLKGLTPQEQFACLIAEEVLTAVANPWDVDGRQGAVDAMLDLPDGRRAAFEVTALAAAGALQTTALLGMDDYQWPSPGKWWWTIQVGSRADLPRLRAVYAHIALLCEAADVTRPEQLWRRDGLSDPDVTWLVEESTSDMFGHPDTAATEGLTRRPSMVVPSGRGGGVDEHLASLAQALAVAFTEPHMARHLDKIARAGTDERHLFVILHYTALPFATAYGLTAGEALPPDAPPLPPRVTHLWLAPQFGRRVLLWTPAGWQQHRLPDSSAQQPTG